MAVNGLKPAFNNKEGYKEWKRIWSEIYSELSQDIRRRKHDLKQLQKAGGNFPPVQKELAYMRSDARKMMTLLNEAKLLRDRIVEAHKQIEEQIVQFPVEIVAPVVDFHFNKKSIAWDWLPKWVLKTKGKSWYVNHIDANIPWSTREMESGSTLGMIRFRKCLVMIDKKGCATINPVV